MESPASALTNILRVDNLHRIPYTLYAPTTRRPNPLQPPEPPVLRTARETAHLRDAERVLKSEGYLVRSDAAGNVLWVFFVEGVSGSGTELSAINLEKDEKWVQLDIRLKDQWGLRETSTGVFLAASLAAAAAAPLPASLPTPRSAASTPATPGLRPEPMTIDLTLDDEEPAPAEPESPLHPYRQFLAAVLSSLAFSLAARDGFTPLNTRTLVSPASMPPTGAPPRQQPRGKPLLQSAPISAPELIAPVVLALEAYMTSLGTLVIAPHAERQPAIRRVATCGLTPACLESREVFIAPWGEWGRLVPPTEEIIDEAVQLTKRQREKKWRKLVIEYLKDYGLVAGVSADEEVTMLQQAIEDGEWREVEIWVRSPRDPREGELHRVLWPSTLLFLRASEADRRSPLPTKEADGDGIWSKASLFDDPEYSQLAEGRLALSLSTLDLGKGQRTQDMGVEWWDVESALVFAEEWVRSRPEREKIMQARVEEKRKQEEQDRIKKEEEGKPPPILEIDKEKKAKGLQDAKHESGVYPTPPDGASSTGLHAPQTSSSDIKEEAPPEPPLPEPAAMELDWPGGTPMPVGRKASDLAVPRAAMGEADLFGGEMDDEMDLFEQGMGVTEDDFNFFDQQPMAAFGGGAMGMGMDMDMGAVGVHDLNLDDDLHMDNAVSMNDGPQQLARPKPLPQGPAPTEPTKMETENYVRTPPLSPHRAIRLLVPGYTSPETLPNGVGPTPPASGSLKSAFSTSNSAPLPLPQSVLESQRKMSIYAPIAFTENVEIADRKYEAGGRFFLPEEKVEEKDATELPTQMERLELLGRTPALKRKRGGFVPASALVAEVAEIALDDDGEDSGDSYYSDSETETSDADDTSYEDEGSPTYFTSPVPPVAPPFVSKKRKRPPEDDGELAMAETLQNDAAVCTEEADTDVTDLPTPRSQMLPDHNEPSLVGVFEELTVTSEPHTVREMGQSEFVLVAWMVNEQMSGWVNSGWNRKSETANEEEEDDEEAWNFRRRNKRDTLRVEDAVKAAFRACEVERCTLDAYASVADAVLDPPPPPPPPGLPPRPGIRPNPALSRRPSEKQPSIFPLPPPHVHLHRADQALEILPPALSFWETFGLGPCSGPKNVIAFCIHPASSSSAEAADFLLDRVGASYEAGRFGAHVRANLGTVITGGLVPVELPAGARTYETGICALLSTMETLGSLIAHGVADEGLNVVIYVLNPFSHDNSFVDLVSGWIRLCRRYEKELAALNAKSNHLALQIVPASFAASKRGPVLRVGVWHRLALEVYGRCTVDPGPTPAKPKAGVPDQGRPRMPATPALTLARKPPSKIDFRLTTDPGACGNLLRENEVLHLAYSQTLDERWVSVAWTDNTGELSKTALFNLSRKGANVLRPFPEVQADIWRHTVDLLSRYSHRWRVCITRLVPAASGGSMPPDEIATWTRFAAQPIQRAKVASIILLSADLSPSVRLEQPAATTAATTGDDIDPRLFLPSSYSTPPPGGVATPTPGGAPTPTGPGTGGFVSPDAFGAAQTPGSVGAGADDAALDPNAVLVEKADECWGVVMAHSWPAEEEVGVGEKCGACGLLVRSGRVVVGVAVVDVVGVGGGGAAAGGAGAAGRGVLVEVLEWWRGLCVLGTWKGGGGAGVPWHLGAVRGVERVGRVM